MRDYVLRRLLLFVPTLFVVSVLIFGIMRVLPGDVALVILGGGEGGSSGLSQSAADQLRESLGLKKPLVIQYTDWIGGLVTGDTQKSLRTHRPVLAEMEVRWPVTIELAFLSIFVSVMVGLPLGILSAIKQDSVMDYILRFISIAGMVAPTFWTAILVLLVLGKYLRWIPPVVFASLLDDPWTNLQQMMPPSLVLGTFLAGSLSRMARSSMLEVLRQDYITTARSKGLRQRVVLYRHALKNALPPIVTLSGVQLAHVIGGVVVIETVFNLPGIGKMLFDSVMSRDFPVTQTVILFLVGAFLVLNLLIDILYARLDPRIRYT